tara:strand:+ start:241 stop:492 length:252 start_codon:yes stop_codon:yes gene_type:complete
LIKHDMEKARDIWRDKIRLARKPILEQLDIEYMRLSEQNADTSVIIETKNKLREFPQRPEFEEAETIEDLRQIWDNSLLGDKD